MDDDTTPRVAVMLRLPASLAARIDRLRAPGVARATAILQLLAVALDRVIVPAARRAAKADVR